MNYNKLNFFGTIFGLIIGIGVMVGLPFIIMGRVPQYFILILVLGIMAFAVIFMFGIMILMLASENLMKKLIAPVIIPAIAMIIFFALITYQMLGPQLVNPDKLPYFDLISQLNPWSVFGYLPLFATGIFFLFLVPFIIYFLKFLFETAFTREKIIKDGISAQAKIIRIQDFGVIVNNEPVYKITLEINSSSYGVYQVTKDFYVPHFTLGELTAGKMIGVKIDPNNPKNIALDTWTAEMSH